MSQHSISCFKTVCLLFILHGLDLCSLVVQWIRLRAPNAGRAVSNSDRELRSYLPHLGPCTATKAFSDNARKEPESRREGSLSLAFSLSSSEEEIALTGSSTKWDQNPVFELP